jgi:cytochrome b561
MSMAQHLRFTTLSRILHWTMAVMVLAMLFIGIGMVASLWDYHWLVSIHKPLGILILILVAIRLVNRLLNPAPPLPEGMPAWQRFAAHASHVVLYALMFALPLVGWECCRPRAIPSCSMGRWNCRRSYRMTPRSTRCCERCTPFWHFSSLRRSLRISARR